jgi:hypothetical protein
MFAVVALLLLDDRTRIEARTSRSTRLKLKREPS